MAGMASIEQKRLIKLYLGVQGGYLAGSMYGFSSISVLEGFYIDCGLDVDPRELEGTNCDKFEQILAKAVPAVQAVIIRGVLKKYPPDQKAWNTRTKELHDEFLAIAARLEGAAPVASPELVYSSDFVKQAITDTENLIKSSGAPSCVDRMHAALHGHLRYLCDQAGISFNDKATINGLFNLLRQHHPAFADTGHRAQDIATICKAIGMVMDALHPLRNNASAAHPNDLLDQPEAMLVVNAARTIVTYLDAKLATGINK